MNFRPRLCWLGAGLLLALLGVLLHGPLTQAIVAAGLRRYGAGEITLEVARATPWSVQLENLSFKIKARQFFIRQFALERAHWWQLSLGEVRIEGMRVPVTVDGSDANPFAWASYAGETPAAGGGFNVPVEKLSVDGQLIVRTLGREQPLELKCAVQRSEKNTWEGAVHATGSGLQCDAAGSYCLSDQRLLFHTTTLAIDLEPWQDFILQMVVLPLGPWSMAGHLTGNVSGSYAEQKLAAGGRLQFAQGRLLNADGSLSAEGIEAELEFTDFIQLQSNPGILRVRELRTGKIVANDLEAELAFLDKDHLAVHRATLKILGGSLSAEPFKFTLGSQELEAVVLTDNLDVEQILSLSKDVPAKGSGRVDGRLPLRIDEHGLRLGTGWLQLRKGVYAEMQLKADGLLTSGMAPNSSGYVVMKRIENGLLRLKLGALRLEVRPPDAQRGQTARLHLEGDPVDPSVKAPVMLDINVNGPLEQLLNFGLQQNLSVGSGK